MLRAVSGARAALQRTRWPRSRRSSQREPALAGARLGSVDRRPLRVPDRGLRLRLRRRRREGGRAHLPRSPHPCRARRALRGHARRPLPARARPARHQPHARRARDGAAASQSSRTPIRGSCTRSRSPRRSPRRRSARRRPRSRPRSRGRPSELTAANAVASGVESIAVFVGPALAGVLLGVASTGVVFTTDRGCSSSSRRSSSSSSTSSAAERPRARARGVHDRRRKRSPGSRRSARHPSLRVMVGCSPPRRRGRSGAGLHRRQRARAPRPRRRRRRLSERRDRGRRVRRRHRAPLAHGREATEPGVPGRARRHGAPARRDRPLADLGRRRRSRFALIGIGNSFVDVAGLTLVQRAVPDDVLARVFGVIQMLLLASMGIGAALAPVLIAWLGVEARSSSPGLFLPVLVLLLGADRRTHRRSRRGSGAPTSCASSRRYRSSRRFPGGRSSTSRRDSSRSASSAGP